MLSNSLQFSHAATVPQLTVDNLSKKSKDLQPQLNAWTRQPQRQEQIALGIETSISLARKQQWLDDIERKVEGKQM